MNEAKFTQTKRAFSLRCRVGINIQAAPEVPWRLLTDAEDFPRWNSTLTAIEGQIREGERLRLHVPGTSRTFRPRVSGMQPNQRMIWSDGLALIFRGERTFTLTPCADGSTDFAMEEHFSGLVFALVKGLMPDFRPIFEKFACDLKREAEGGAE